MFWEGVMSDLSAIKLNGTTYTLSDDYARDSMAKIEYGTLATKAYDVGDFIINNNHLYKVTSAIAIGVKFVVGTNIELVKLSDEVKLKAPLASPTFTGTPKVPTASTGTKTTQIASTAYVQNEIDIVNNNVQSTIDYVQNELGGVLTSLRGDLTSLDSEVDTISDDVDSLDSAVNILTRQGTTLRNDGIVVCNAVDGGDNVFFMIDDTLTEAHKAADAKATGNAIGELKENLSKSVSDLKSAFNDLENRFDNPNVMDYASLQYDDRFVVTSGQIRPNDTGTNSIIFAVEPSTTYYLHIVGGFNRRVLAGNDTNTFTTNTTYTPISTTNDGITGVIFTTPEGVNFVFLYFYKGTFTFDPNNFKLYEGNVLPSDTNPTVKKSSLPSDIVYNSNFSEVNVEKTNPVYGFGNYTKNHALTGSGSNFSETEVNGVGVSDPIYDVAGKPIRWYHGVNTLTSFTLWLVEYKSDGSVNTAWGMLANAEYRDIVSLKSDTEYIRCSFILSYADARVQIANTESSSTIYWKPEHIGGVNVGNIPAYYFADQYLQQKCERINNLLRSKLVRGDAFFFITDVHWDLNTQHSPALIQYIHDHTGINKIFDGGDRDDGYGLDPVRYEMNAIRNDNVFPVIGNHEYLRSASRSDAFASAYQHIGNNVSWGEPGSFYYYYDNGVQKIRYIFLQSFNPSGTDAGAVNGYTEDELTWFTGAMNVATGWTIIIVTHSLLIWNRDTKEPVTPTGITAQFVNAIESYEGNGTIACVIQGHIHGDWVYTLTNGVPIITTTCDKNDFYNEPTLSDVSRPTGTIDEQAFDVFIIDTANRNINAVRIGCAKDFVDDVTVQERTISY
jgi:hypothetical protein